MTACFRGIDFWAYTLTEYKLMFDLSEKDLAKNILDCAAGPASFTAEMSKKNANVVAVDPLFSSSSDEIKEQGTLALRALQEKLKEDGDAFKWKTFASPADLINEHSKAQYLFLKDFEVGKKAERYITASLPTLDFKQEQFQLALCSHFFFMHEEKHSLAFHLESIKELCRVATEVRIFPLLDSEGEVTKLAGPIMMALQEEGYGIEVREVAYQFREGGNAMLRVWATECKVEE